MTMCLAVTTPCRVCRRHCEGVINKDDARQYGHLYVCVSRRLTTGTTSGGGGRKTKTKPDAMEEIAAVNCGRVFFRSPPVGMFSAGGFLSFIAPFPLVRIGSLSTAAEDYLKNDSGNHRQKEETEPGPKVQEKCSESDCNNGRHRSSA